MKNVKIDSWCVEITHGSKVLFPEDNLTKADLVDYYRRIADIMIPHMKNRALMMHRYPDGLVGEEFYQKRVPDYFPDWIRREKVQSEKGPIEHVVCDNTATLIYLANQACITPHLWLSLTDQPNHPDQLIFDLDPSIEDFSAIRTVALDLKDLLEELELIPFIMSTGSRGVHIRVPLNQQATFDRVRQFAKDVAELLTKRNPEMITIEHRKEKRGDRIFLDTNRNAYAQTAVAPYAIRARKSAPISVPLDWEEVKDPQFHPRRYHIKNIFRRLGQKEDPWNDIHLHQRGIEKPQQALHALMSEF